MPKIRLQDKTELEVSPEQQAKLAKLVMTQPDLRVNIQGQTIRIKDITHLNIEPAPMPLLEKFKQQGLDTSWLHKFKPPQ